MSKHKSSFPLRNSDYPNTFISEIDVSLDDPDHEVKLVWKGPKAKDQETGPFKSSPGAGVIGMDCNDEKTSQTSGSMCTPKGTRTVESIQDRLGDDEHATHVTMFDNHTGPKGEAPRGIALHFYPNVPDFPASHGCVRLKEERVAELIHDNVVVNVTKVVVSGTWKKPAHQWAGPHHKAHPKTKAKAKAKK
jgi:hypothetical protein